MPRASRSREKLTTEIINFLYESQGQPDGRTAVYFAEMLLAEISAKRDHIAKTRASGETRALPETRYSNTAAAR